MTSTANTQDVRRPDFLVFSDDWGEHPSSCQHIFRHIARDHRVLWVNTIGMRNPTFTLRDARKVLRKLTRMFDSRRSATFARRIEGRMTVCQPFMLPGIRWPVVRAFNARSVTKSVGSLLQDKEFDDPIIVTTVPNSSEYPKLLEGRKVVYYCVDDFSLWPGLDAQLVHEMESRLVARADCLIGVSEALCDRLRSSGKFAHLLAHGVDVDHFATKAEHEHHVLSKIPRPRVGFFGLIDGRMDWELMVTLAKSLPNVAFVFAGPVDASAGVLPQQNNLNFVGSLRYEELPNFICGVDALILPYKINGLAQVLSPLKLKEYLSTGKPVISAPIGAAEEWADAISIARDPVEWKEALHKVLQRDMVESTSVTARSFAAQSWSSKAIAMLSLCNRLDEAKGVVPTHDIAV